MKDETKCLYSGYCPKNSEPRGLKFSISYNIKILGGVLNEAYI